MQHGATQRDRVEPAAAPRPTRDGAELVPDAREMLAHLVEELGRERTRADARRVGLHDAEHGVDVARAEAGADGRLPRDRVRRGDERIGADIDVEQRALRTFEQQVPAGPHLLRAAARLRPRPAAAAARPARGSPRACAGNRRPRRRSSAAARSCGSRAPRRVAPRGARAGTDPRRARRGARPCPRRPDRCRGRSCRSHWRRLRARARGRARRATAGSAGSWDSRAAARRPARPSAPARRPP